MDENATAQRLGIHRADRHAHRALHDELSGTLATAIFLFLFFLLFFASLSDVSTGASKATSVWPPSGFGDPGRFWPGLGSGPLSARRRLELDWIDDSIMPNGILMAMPERVSGLRQEGSDG